MFYYFFDKYLPNEELLKIINNDKITNAIIFCYVDENGTNYSTKFITKIVINGEIDDNTSESYVHIGLMNNDLSEIINSFKRNNDDINGTINFLKRKNLLGHKVKKFNKSLFTLGNLHYYSMLKFKFSESELKKIYSSTNDISFNNFLYDFIVSNKEAFNKSFLNNITPHDFQQISRYVKGDSKYKNHKWVIETLKGDNKEQVMSFSNIKTDQLDSNVFSIIGNNGVGKTSLLKDILLAANDFGNFIQSKFDIESKIRIKSEFNEDDKISHIVFINYSSLDVFEDDLVKLFKKRNPKGLVLLSNRDSNDINRIISPKEFSQQLEIDLEWIDYNNGTNNLLRKIITEYFNDSENLVKFINKATESSYTSDSEGIRQDALKYAEKLSSGQKMIISMLINLINNANDNSLFLLDEPETYLHPPFLLSLINSIDYLTSLTNSICIVATHSSITLQQLQNNNVFIIDDITKYIHHPKLKTFAANSQRINNEIFGVDIRNTGYIKKIDDLLNKNTQDDIDKVIKSGILSEDALFYLLSSLERRK